MRKYFSKQFTMPFLTTAVFLLALAAASDSPNRRLRIEDRHSHALPSSAQIHERFGKLPLSFERNQGQAGGAAQFIARGPNSTIYLDSTGATLDLQGRSRLQLKLRGASADPLPKAINPLPGHSNYFIGADPREWRTDVPNYARVQYRNVYRGVDLVYYGNGRQLEYDFVVAPRADSRQIELAFEGADKIELDPQGDLQITLGRQQLHMRKPVVYQEVDGRRHEIAGGYTLTEPIRNPQSAIRNPTVGFQIGEYDPAQPLVIDPVVNYATFYGGSGTDIAYGIAVDSTGAVYVAGQTSSLNFPLRNPFDSTLEGANDAFVMKLNPQGNAVVFATYIGGRNQGDRAWSIAVDKAGNVYFTGETNSLNFPVANAAQAVFRGNVDGFVVKLSIEGSVLLYSTYLGGGFTDVAYSIALDRFDNAYITGRTESANFPVKTPLQDRLRGQRDAFVTKYSPDGEILYSTFLGGDPATAGARDEDAGYGIAVDALQQAYITGYTTSPSFPLVRPLQSVFGGVEDAFITKLNTAGTGILYSTYLGGTRADDGRGIAIDTHGNAYVIGYTLSQDFPRVEALQPVNGGGGDGFVAKINAAGSSLIYSTYLGGTGGENIGLISDLTPACAIAVDSLGNAYVTGKTESQNFPVARAVNGTLRGDDDAYVAKIDPAGSELIYSTYLGSTFTGNNGFEERGLGIAADRLGTVFVTGQMLKNDFQTVTPVQGTYGGGLSDGFIAKISAPDIAGIAALSAASFAGGSFAPESIAAAFGANLASGTEIATSVPLPTTLLGTTVKVTDKAGVERAAQMFFVSPGQVNFLIPRDTAPGKATIAISNAQTGSLGSTVLIESFAPGLFSATATGQGFAAAVALRVKQDGTQIFEPVVQLDGLGKLVAVPIDLGPETEQVFLLLFGTGWRNNSQLMNVSVRIGGNDVPVLYAGAQGSFVGQDQINLRLPRTLAGRGELSLVVTIDGRLSNAVNVTIR